MAYDYQKVQTQDTDLNKVQTNIAALGQSIPSPEETVQAAISLGIVTVKGPKTYMVGDTDRHVVCYTVGGPVTVALPSPSVPRALGVLCTVAASGAGQVTVQRKDGQPSNFGSQVLLDPGSARVFVADGKNWN